MSHCSNSLLAAVEACDLQAVRELLAQADVHEETLKSQLKAALHSAAARGHLDMTSLLAAHASCDITSHTGGVSVLHWAARGNHVDIIQFLGKQSRISELLELQDSERRSALHWAVMHGHAEATRALIDIGIDVSVQSSSGQTALHIATAKYDSAELVLGRDTCAATTLAMVDMLLQTGSKRMLNAQDIKAR